MRAEISNVHVMELQLPRDFESSKDMGFWASSPIVFYGAVFRHHGLADSIISDRHLKFTAKFWKELMRLCGVELCMSTGNHPQTDVNSEIMNRMVQNY